MGNRILIICLAALVLTACGHRRGAVVIDPKGVDMAQYQYDLAECEQVAEQVNSKAAGGAVGGAMVGGAIGAIVGNSNTAAKGAGVGAVSGGAKGAASTRREKQKVIKNCMRYRGYRVLN